MQTKQTWGTDPTNRINAFLPRRMAAVAININEIDL